MTRTPAEAVAWAQNQSGHGPKAATGMCLKMVRTALGVGAKYASAAVAWEHAEHRHAEGTPPAGVPVFWTGGSHGYGHIALSAGGGKCWSTDIKRNGYFDLVSIATIADKWGQHYVGWAEDVNGVRVYEAPAAKPAAKPVVVAPVKPALRLALAAVCHDYSVTVVAGARALLAYGIPLNAGTRKARMLAAAVNLKGMK